MVSDFFATTVDDWDDPSGALHAYLLPDDATVDALRPALAALEPLDYLAVQPASGLPATVLRFPSIIAELGADPLRDLEAAVAAAAAGQGPLELTFGEPHPTSDSVLLAANADEGWDSLVELIRRAGKQALGDGADLYAPPFAPHLTLAYATGDGDDARINELLDEAGACVQLGPVRFGQIAWCAVHQNRFEGTYTFDVLFHTPLGTGS